MPGTQQKRLLLGIFENLPGLSFLILSQASGDLRLAGWIGAVLAGFVCATYIKHILDPHPILLGINVFTVGITPLIEGLFLLDMPHQAQWLVQNVDTAVLSSVFLIGLALTLFAPNGFLACRTETRRQTLIYSAVLLAASGTGIIWSAFVDASPLLSLAMPLSLLFGLRQYLCAGLSDRQSLNSGLTALPGATAPSADLTV
ncbi:MAG: hypothetical protein AB3N21_02900 [Ruegeria sp.]|uniref:hypothetical protein n=1 Tax=Ruegeria sp. TaxID=1879320 RepID=UPI00349ECACE